MIEAQIEHMHLIPWLVLVGMFCTGQTLVRMVLRLSVSCDR